MVFLLFVIGLELEPKRLWNMRTQLLGLGSPQVVGSIAAITLAGWALGFDWRVALIAGMALSLSSTALALAPLDRARRARDQGRPGHLRGAAVPGHRRDPDARGAAAARRGERRGAGLLVAEARARRWR